MSAKTIHVKRIVFSTNGTWTTEHSDAKKKKLDTDLISFTKNELEMYHRPKYIMQYYKISEVNMGKA